jgi:serine/threonine-protein kinase
LGTVYSEDSRDSSASILESVLEACRRFDAGWKRGERPRIEDALAASKLPAEALLPRLLPLELASRRALGERPLLGEYLARFPAARPIVEAAFEPPTTRDPAPASTRDAPRSEPRHGAAREILVGILALQNGFIDHVELIRAIQSWALDKGRRLGAILLEAGKLDCPRLALLEALADEHRKLCGDDLQASLASFGALAPVIQAVRRMGDRDVETSFAGDPSKAASAEETVSLPPDDGRADGGEAAAASDRFQDLRFHRCGALGKVSNALDRELNRRVAFKEILDENAHQESNRLQFILEGLVTGGLEHPGIVPVYSLGCRADGRPYYAMRFIQGPSLRDKIRLLHARKDARPLEPGEDAPTLPRLLRHFIHACQAVAYAHSRGVLHRDLKPDHVMIGPFGETLVVDWGLAMPIPGVGRDGRATDETLQLPRDLDSVLSQDGTIVGTPAYMSPEQALGQQSRLDRTSDVYSLGAVLYALLAGEAPFQGGDFVTVLGKARAGDFSPPRRVKADVPAPLEAICLKAMSFRQEDRYESAAALARDVENWLDDEPVLAYPEGWPARAGRWLRRNRTAAVGFATALVSAVVALTALNVQTRRANVVIAASHLQAEANFGMALDVVTNLLRKIVRNELPKTPGAEALWMQIAEQAANSMETLQAQRSDDPKVLDQAAAAYRELGNVLRLQGDERAASAYRRAIELLRKASQMEAANPAYRDRLVEILFEGAESERLRGRHGTAEPFYREASRIAAGLIEEFPFVPDYQRTNARACYNYSEWFAEAGDYTEAARLLEYAVSVFKPLADSQKPGPFDQLEATLALESLGSALNREAGSAAAESVLREAIARAEAMLRANDDPDLRFIRAAAKYELGRAVASSRSEAAIGHLDDALQALDRLISEYPETEHYNHVKAAALEARGVLSIAGGRRAAGLEDLKRARETLAALLKDSPDHPVYSGLLGRVLGALASESLEGGDIAEARTLLAEAARLQAVALTVHPRNPVDLQAARRHEELRRRLESQPAAPPP